MLKSSKDATDSGRFSFLQRLLIAVKLYVFSFAILSDLSVDVIGVGIVIFVFCTVVGRDWGLNNSTNVKDPFV